MEDEGVGDPLARARGGGKLDTLYGRGQAPLQFRAAVLGLLNGRGRGPARGLQVELNVYAGRQLSSAVQRYKALLHVDIVREQGVNDLEGYLAHAR